MEIYDRDYYERGLETGKSCYQNYRWVPELTIPMAMAMIDLLGIKRGQTVLDYGCAFGFLVKALRLLGRKAWGVDISTYAIENADPSEHCFLKAGNYLHGKAAFLQSLHSDFCIAKDVFEHIPYSEIVEVFEWINADTMFAIIPLGENDKYRAPANNLDVTHKICKDETWWTNLLEKNGWELQDFTFRIEGIKDSYYEKHPKAHGFFTLEKVKC